MWLTASLLWQLFEETSIFLLGLEFISKFDLLFLGRWTCPGRQASTATLPWSSTSWPTDTYPRGGPSRRRTSTGSRRWQTSRHRAGLHCCQTWGVYNTRTNSFSGSLSCQLVLYSTYDRIRLRRHENQNILVCRVLGVAYFFKKNLAKLSFWCSLLINDFCWSLGGGIGRKTVL